jgi:hypothetical protein
MSQVIDLCLGQPYRHRLGKITYTGPPMIS